MCCARLRPFTQSVRVKVDMDIDRKKLKNQGYALGFGVFVAIGLALYSFQFAISDVVGDDWASIIIFIPAFCAFLVIGLVAERYALFMERRICGKRGHIYEKITPDKDEPYVVCKQCHHYQKSRSHSD